MANLNLEPQPQKLSFAKIAAAGHQNANTNPKNTDSITAAARDGAILSQDTDVQEVQAQGHVNGGSAKAVSAAQLVTDSVATISSDIPVIVGASARTIAASELGRTSSVGGKSTTSATTFGMDEKGSVRPDDSASMAAVEDMESASPLHARASGSTEASDDGAQAFQEQLNEISTIDPHVTRAGNTFPALANSSTAMAFTPVSPDGTLLHEMPPDTKLLDALDNPRDRIWVLKLEQDIIDFVKDGKESSLVLPQCNSFYRMLAHKIGDYYMLGHTVNETNAAVRLFKTPASRIARPLTGVVTPSTAASTPPPSAMQMKILRRGVDLAGSAVANRSNNRSKNASENGESSNDDDLKKVVTREERAARYEAARLRIMGSAKPSESPERPKEADNSRSSSVTDKRKKKQRDDSNDDFEARSAYNSYVTPAVMPHSAYAPASFAYPPQAYAVPNSPTYTSGYEYGTMPSQPPYWYPQPIDQPMMWTQSPQQPFDLSREFHQSMSLQQPASPMYPSSQQQQHSSMPFNQLAGFAPYAWSPGPGQQNERQPFNQASYDAATTEGRHSQPYAYGQLPSQALGRPPNALEHPLPGSYKSRHFNPQSLTFIPGHTSGDNFPPSPQQRTFVGTIRGSGTLERQTSSHSQMSPTNSPHRLHRGSLANAMMSPSALNHPLPQPVFPSHAVPSTALPPKPSSVHSSEQAHNSHQSPQQANGTSTLAKWGTPASLPAKPPPPATDGLDSPKSPVTPSRSMNHIASPRMPVFGSMPPA